jgi:shikimate 5-dehydrogenase
MASSDLCSAFESCGGSRGCFEKTGISIDLWISPDCSLIVNATPLGMAPQTDASPWPMTIPLPNNVSVYDLVYMPEETTLTKAASKTGLRATTGLGMLIEQAALSFERWTSQIAPRGVMLQAAREALAATQRTRGR